MCQFHSKLFIVWLVSAFRPTSVNDNLRERYHTILGYDMLSVSEGGLTAETSLTIKMLLWH